MRWSLHLHSTHHHVVGFVHELDWCQLLLSAGRGSFAPLVWHCCWCERHWCSCFNNRLQINYDLWSFHFCSMYFLWSYITNGYLLDCRARYFLISEVSMKLEIYPSICPWANLERIDNMNKIDSLKSYFSINLLKHPKASYHLQVPTTLIMHNLVPKLCWVHQG